MVSTPNAPPVSIITATLPQIEPKPQPRKPPPFRPTAPPITAAAPTQQECQQNPSVGAPEQPVPDRSLPQGHPRAATSPRDPQQPGPGRSLTIGALLSPIEAGCPLCVVYSNPLPLYLNPKLCGRLMPQRGLDSSAHCPRDAFLLCTFTRAY